MRISDWSSDVCSSDLLALFVAVAGCVLAGLLPFVPNGKLHVDQRPLSSRDGCAGRLLGPVGVDLLPQAHVSIPCRCIAPSTAAWAQRRHAVATSRRV